MCANQVHTVASGLLQLQIAGPDYSGRGYEAIPLSMSTFSSSIASAAIQGPVVVVGTADCDAPLQQKHAATATATAKIHPQAER